MKRLYTLILLLGVSTLLFSQQSKKIKENDPVVDSVQVKYIAKPDYRQHMVENGHEDHMWDYYVDNEGKVYKYFSSFEAVIANLRGYHKRDKEGLVKGVVYVKSEGCCQGVLTENYEWPSKVYLRESNAFFVK